MKRLIVLFLLLVPFLQAGDDSMPAYVLVRMTERGDPSNPMNYLPGYPVGIFDRNQYVAAQILPNFGQVIITDATVGQLRLYCDEWQREIEWEIVSSDFPTDTHQIRAFTKPELVSASGMNGLTRDKVESFLNQWNASVQSTSPNSVVFSAKIADAIASQGFWGGLDITFALFAEKSYVAATGIHETEIDYSAIAGATAERLASEIVNRGCTVTQSKPAQKKIAFACGRDVLFQNFKWDVKERVDSSYARRKWRFTQITIDAIIAAGGSIEVTRTQALDLLRSRLND